MFAKTFCKPGSYLCVVPIGLQVTLQYNAKGLLEKVFLGYGDNKTNITNDVLSELLASKTVPGNIHLKQGTTWVKGVLHSQKVFTTPGVLPTCIESEMLEDLQYNTQDYTFYAGTVESMAASFRGAMITRNWLSMAGFTLLPGFIAPVNLDATSFELLMNNDKYPFKYPFVSGFLVFEGTDAEYHNAMISQDVVKTVKRHNDINGYIKATLSCVGQYKEVHYSDVVKHNIHTNTLLIMNSCGDILSSVSTDSKKRDKRSATISCSVCGKSFRCPTSGPVKCEDLNCRSTMYGHIQKLLCTFSLPSMDEKRFQHLLENDEIVCLTDVLILEEYRDAKISCTLDKILQACIPVTVCSDTSLLTAFVSRCSNSWNTLQYYLLNPQKIPIDLDMSSPAMKKVIDWLSDSYNVSTIQTLVESDQITIVTSSKKFDGAPIFRDRTILVTGKFMHGDLAEVSAILQSYSAKVVTQYDKSVGCLVVGSLKENIDGKAIQAARANNIPVFDEVEFFKKYTIDEDLAANNLLLF